MKSLEFKYPIMVFAKCGCTNQVPVTEMLLEEKGPDNYDLHYSLTCPVCNGQIEKSLSITEEAADFTSLFNVFKTIPALKDELSIIKFDMIKGKVKDGSLALYGKYSHLRFWDNVVQSDIIKIPYTIK
ncbi:hypothetical protein [Geosporobacter ferrireducens]|uniref:Uncharacterized protein n=1 Tax=Geosporobacter ferrireducens TaxID=1424294 RepID=A0A1D8GE79_9FIRM|nr:hypothetical protein [Geosporobacter ferrireducens]AOT69223.1 hypothetical protein Gferi_06380 [Geosporobacter ferrireducens]MTI56903.1 hypothetical protein [Geosporobacter ferrireducens]